MSASNGNGIKKPVRCAIYTRKSTEEGLEQEFNTLDAQREACEAFIKSQVHEGWVLVPDRFDDGGFTGANIERPALKRLMAKVEAKEIDTVVIYKLDRLTRSIRDFGRIMDAFEANGVSFVSVSQRIDTTTSMGRLMLHILLSFAQFEREMTSERTRDKMVAARRKGKWTGGFPPLGFDLLRDKGHLAVNGAEAEQVNEIYRLYLQNESLMATVTELNRRGWRTKTWTNKEGMVYESHSWSKVTLKRMLSNRVYLGQITYRSESYPAAHPAIVAESLFNKVQEVLAHGREHGPARSRNSFAYLLRGLVFCKVCRSAMAPATTKKGKVNYRYYRCTSVDKKGTDACPVRYAPAEPLEQFVIGHQRRLGREPELIEETLKEAEKQIKESLANLGGERKRLEAESRRIQAEARHVLTSKLTGSTVSARLAELEEQQGGIGERLAEIETESRKLAEAHVNPKQAKEALALFDPVWDVLEAQDRERLVRLVIQQVQYDGGSGEIALAFHPLGLSQLAVQAQGMAPQCPASPSRSISTQLVV